MSWYRTLRLLLPLCNPTKTVIAPPLASRDRFRYIWRGHHLRHLLLPGPRSPYVIEQQIHYRRRFCLSHSVSILTRLSTSTLTAIQTDPFPGRSRDFLPPTPSVYRSLLYLDLLLHLDANRTQPLTNRVHNALSQAFRRKPQHRLRCLRH